ncbi:hypothetical protein ACFE04_016104 [Oxalis oulophora]
MSADDLVKKNPNPCCAVWIAENEKLKESRNKLRQAVKDSKNVLLHVDKIRAESVHLKKVTNALPRDVVTLQIMTMFCPSVNAAYDEEKVRVATEKDGKEKEKALRVSLEKEISALRTEVYSLKQKEGSEWDDKSIELELLQAHVSEGEKEISKLKDLLEKADSYKKNAETDKKKLEKEINYLKNLLEKEKMRMKSEEKNAEVDKKLDMEISNLKEFLAKEKIRADDYKKQLEVLKKEAERANAELVSKTSMFEEVNKKLEAEKQMVIKEKKRAHDKKKKAEMQKNLTKDNRKIALGEKSRSEKLSQQLQEAKQKIEELQNLEEIKPRSEFEIQNVLSEKNRADLELIKTEEQRQLAEAWEKTALDEKKRADQMSHELGQSRKMIEQLQKQICDHSSFRDMPNSGLVYSTKDTTESLSVKLLKKELEIEKSKGNHFRELAKLEKSRNSILSEELGQLNQDFVQYSNRLDALHKCFSTCGEGTHDVEKAGDLLMLKLNENTCTSEPFCKNESLNPVSIIEAASDQTFRSTEPRLPMCGVCYKGSVSGINSQLESLIGGSNQKILQSSAINSSMASFSDGQFVGSQGRGSATPSTKLLEENLNLQPTVSSLSGEVNKMNCIEKSTLVAEKNIKNGRKRKWMNDAIKSVGSLYSKSKKLHGQLDEKLSVLHDMLNTRVNEPSEKANLILGEFDSHDKDDKLSKKRRIHYEENTDVFDQATERDNGIAEFELSLRKCSDDQVTAIRLLDFDNSMDEECFKKVLEEPLSPTIPLINVQEDEMFITDNSKPSTQKGFFQSLSDKNNDPLLSCNFNLINVDTDTNKLLLHEEACSKNISIPEFCVVFSDIKDSSNISSVFCATSRLAQLLLSNERDWIMHKILYALKKEEHLSSREKVCVFFSLLLLNFYAVNMEWPACFLDNNLMSRSNSFTAHICTVMSDVETRGLFLELYLEELLFLIEEFLIHGRVMEYTNETSGTSFRGLNLTLSSKPASLCHLIIASIFLPSICVTLNHMDFICKASYNILRTCRRDPSTMLTILHSFAFIGGERYITQKEQHSLTMAVVKSTITLLESEALSGPQSSCPFLSSDCNLYNSCPFTEKVSSMDITAALVMEKLHSYTNNGVVNHNMMLLDDSFVDVLSMVELFACKMSWKWTCDNLLYSLLKILESSLQSNTSLAVIVLLGQIGRLGVEAAGYEDKEVENLRSALSSLLMRDTKISHEGLPFQIATINSLRGLISVDFEQAVQSDPNLLENASQWIHFDRMHKWFSGLSKEQQDLSFRIFQRFSLICMAYSRTHLTYLIHDREELEFVFRIIRGFHLPYGDLDLELLLYVDVSSSQMCPIWMDRKETSHDWDFWVGWIRNLEFLFWVRVLFSIVL